ncbi:MAG: ArnT family glycosyltransferase [Thermodesulfobacteriota bacterium]
MKSFDDSPGPGVLSFGFGMLLCVLILIGSFYNLANFPTIWWDEAIFSETAANLAQHNRYAFTVESPNQLNDLDFRISVGPAVILPVALAYKLFGVNLVSGRLVAGAYLVFAFLALFLIARRLWGTSTALLTVALAFLGTDVFYWGRSVLGDIPALGLFLCALYFLILGLESPLLWPLVLGGVFLGLAFDAKEFYGLAFLPPLLILARQTWGDKRRLALRVLALGAGSALPLLAYLLLKAVILGSLTGAVLHFLEQKRLLCHEFFTPFTIGRIYPESVIFLLRHPLFWLGMAGSVWLYRNGKLAFGAKLWIWNFLLWSAVYLTAVYWHRFALPALFLASPLAADFLLQGSARLTSWGFARAPRWLAPGIIAAFLVLFYPLAGLNYLKDVLTCRSEAPSRLVEYLRTHIPSRCLIETPEYELVFLDDEHRIHLMPSYFFVESTPDRVVLLNPRKEPYNFDRVGADVLILGSFGKSVFKQVYPPARINRDWRRIAQVDYYDIYIPKKCEKEMLKLINLTSASYQKIKKNNLIRPVIKRDVQITSVDSYYH